jgi:hypothetical protein
MSDKNEYLLVKLQLLYSNLAEVQSQKGMITVYLPYLMYDILNTLNLATWGNLAKVIGKTLADEIIEINGGSNGR